MILQSMAISMVNTRGFTGIIMHLEHQIVEMLQYIPEQYLHIMEIITGQQLRKSRLFTDSL